MLRIEGIRVGHCTKRNGTSGCTVVIAEKGAVCAVDVRGGAPGGREIDALRPENLVTQAHAIVLSGGSAYGLDAAGGVMQFLKERKIGFPIGPDKVVPIVPAAIINDLELGDNYNFTPTGRDGYKACQAAFSIRKHHQQHKEATREGSVGAGAGATVGKIFGMDRAMKAGLGISSRQLDNGLVVSALMVVNALGDVLDVLNQNKLVAGVRSRNGQYMLDARRLVMEELENKKHRKTTNKSNTTIGVVVTNAKLTKSLAKHVASMGQDGIARTIYPAHTHIDGDTLFVLATGTWKGHADISLVGTLAADVVAEAIIRGTKKAKSVDTRHRLPSFRDHVPLCYNTLKSLSHGCVNSTGRIDEPMDKSSQHDLQLAKGQKFTYFNEVCS